MSRLRVLSFCAGIPALCAVVFAVAACSSIQHNKDAVAAQSAVVDKGEAETSDWSPPVAPYIEGYANLTSVVQGGQISFMVRTTEPTYNISFYRNSTWIGAPKLTVNNLVGHNYTYPSNAYAVGCGWPVA